MSPNGMRPDCVMGPFSSQPASRIRSAASAAPGVAVPPGRTALTRIPSTPNSSAAARVRFVTPALLAPYAAL